MFDHFISFLVTVKYTKLECFPINIPKEPNTYYFGIGWDKWCDFLGSKQRTKLKEYVTYEEAYSYSSKLNLKNTKEWYLMSKNGENPNNIPRKPSDVYKNKGWVSWGVFLNTGFVASMLIRNLVVSYSEAKEIIKPCELKSNKEWRSFVKQKKFIDMNIPKTPERVYKNEWVSWGDFLGTCNINSSKMFFCTFEETKKIIKKLKIERMRDYIILYKSGEYDIPSNPIKYYKNEWISYEDFYGSEKHRPITYDISYENAKKDIIKYDIKSVTEWNVFAKSDKFPDHIPKSPDGHFKIKGTWISWGDFLGTGTIAPFNIVYLPFDEAREFTRNQKFNSIEEWKNFMRTNKLDNMAFSPHKIYKNDGWCGYSDFLGCDLFKNNSYGESRIVKYLDGNDVKYIREKTFDTCKNIKLLKFDFHLYADDILIEYDGIQHFEPVEYFGGEESFKKTKMRDEIKTQWCIDNNIKLIRIPYYDYADIEDILSKILK